MRELHTGLEGRRGARRRLPCSLFAPRDAIGARFMGADQDKRRQRTGPAKPRTRVRFPAPPPILALRLTSRAILWASTPWERRSSCTAADPLDLRLPWASASDVLSARRAAGRSVVDRSARKAYLKPLGWGSVSCPRCSVPGRELGPLHPSRTPAPSLRRALELAPVTLRRPSGALPQRARRAR